METYLIFTIGRDGHFERVREIRASSDAEALDRARQMLDKLDLEVWRSGSRVAAIPVPKRA
jgi:hypothetical protein